MLVMPVMELFRMISHLNDDSSCQGILIEFLAGDRFAYLLRKNPFRRRGDGSCWREKSQCGMLLLEVV